MHSNEKTALVYTGSGNRQNIKLISWRNTGAGFDCEWYGTDSKKKRCIRLIFTMEGVETNAKATW